MIDAKTELSLDTKKYIHQFNINDKNFVGEKRVYVTRDENLEKIHLMGLDWWSKFGEEAIKFIED